MRKSLIQPTVKLYIDGKITDASPLAAGIELYKNLSPSSGEVICDVQKAQRNDVERAVASSEEGFQKWSRTSPTQRSRILAQAARLIRERTEELAHLEVLDTGKPMSEALACDIPSSADGLDYFAGVAPTLRGDHYDLGGSFVYTRREPLGVCAGIGAWNYPLQVACWKSAPALACGNSMIFKPSELTPLTAMKLAEIYTEAGLPDGVFNVLQGAQEVGQALATHPKIRKISLTGSVPTGKKVMAMAADSLKHLTLELGGKSPLILFADCRIEQAVSGALLANFYTQGEICCNGTRVFVEESLYEEFIRRLVPRIQEIRVGDPFDPQTQVGALISRPHQEKVLRYIETAQREGAKLVCGGAMNDGRLVAGNFVRPTLLTECHDDMTHVQEEIFGPVMSILKFKEEAEVIARANHTHYGLAAGVFTQDLQRAHRVAAALEAGTCWINNYNLTPVEVPFGGYKQSGLGRENGLAVLEHYTQLKSVYVEMGDVKPIF